MAKKSVMIPPPLWAGIECSFNRVGDHYHDQMKFTVDLLSDESFVEHLVSLGIKTWRYPVLWEHHHSRHATAAQHWERTASRLNRLLEAGIRPVVGLMHHGYGPPYTGLLDPLFPEHFAAYAKTVAERLPGVADFVLINEPLTTARFSGLYGLWYPHARNDETFALLLLHQMKAVVLAMEAIGKVNAEARFIQTEDLSKTYATPLLQYQADFENERRWLTFDLLCGRLDTRHPLWDFFLHAGVQAKLLSFFTDHAAPPDLIGVDHYLTSERFLDENLECYPPEKHGGNGRHAYVDVEAIRVAHPGPSGLEVLMRECYDRYRLPMIIAETHLGGTPREQILWLCDRVVIASRLKREGIPVEAVTVWAVFGSSGWDQLLIQVPGHYEAGVYDLRNGVARETEYTAFVRKVASGKALIRQSGDGWWHKEERLYYHPFRVTGELAE